MDGVRCVDQSNPSIGDKSGDSAGHSSKGTLLLARHYVVTRTVISLLYQTIMEYVIEIIIIIIIVTSLEMTLLEIYCHHL